VTKGKGRKSADPEIAEAGKKKNAEIVPQVFFPERKTKESDSNYLCEMYRRIPRFENSLAHRAMHYSINGGIEI